jgi:hypothetical protein
MVVCCAAFSVWSAAMVTCCAAFSAWSAAIRVCRDPTRSSISVFE